MTQPPGDRQPATIQRGTLNANRATSSLKVCPDYGIRRITTTKSGHRLDEEVTFSCLAMTTPFWLDSATTRAATPGRWSVKRARGGIQLAVMTSLQTSLIWPTGSNPVCDVLIENAVAW